MRILFILKNQLISGGYSAPGRSSGLYASAQFVCDMLETELGYTCKLAVVGDNNDIDREVALFRPAVVIIEALWVVPEKFKLLHRLHPDVQWVVRNHSAVPFLAHEGSAMSWLLRYPEFRNVHIGCNDLRTKNELQTLINSRGLASRVLNLPNYYPPQFHPRQQVPVTGSHQLHVGCFGAIRPLKNQLIQAVAAINYAERAGKHLNFHINGTRLEGGGEPIMKNLRSLFDLTPHRLVEHNWLDREAFLKLARRMDAAMQCSYTETFNIVSADCVMNDVPVVVSPEIEWVDPRFQADPNDSREIAHTLSAALHFARHFPHAKPNRDRLRVLGRQSVVEWAGVLSRLAYCERAPAEGN